MTQILTFLFNHLTLHNVIYADIYINVYIVSVYIHNITYHLSRENRRSKRQRCFKRSNVQRLSVQKYKRLSLFIPGLVVILCVASG